MNTLDSTVLQMLHTAVLQSMQNYPHLHRRKKLRSIEVTGPREQLPALFTAVLKALTSFNPF